MTTYGYKWDIDGLEVVTPQDGAQQFIECERGTRSSKACFYLRREDADKLFTASSSKTITVTPSIRNGSEWEALEPIAFKGYLACERSEVDQLGNVLVTLRDIRHKLERASIDEPFNTVFLVALTSAGTRTLYTIYDSRTCQPSNVPWDYQDIIDKVLDPAGFGTIALPVAPGTPDNIQCTGSCAEVLAGLLAAIGCDMVFDPFEGDLTIVKLSDNDTREELQAAKDDLRLIAKVERKLQDAEKHGEVVASPADYFPIRYVDSDTSNFGDGKQSVLIIDHQLADETTKKVKAARMTEIKQAVQDWYLAESDMLDETYYGIIKRGPSEKLRSVCWMLSNPKANHRTRFVNDAIPMPWPKRTEHVYQASLVGKTTSGGLSTVSLEKVAYWKDAGTGIYADSGYFVEASTRVSSIIGVADVLLFPTEAKFVAVRVC